MRAVTTEEMRRLDERAIREFGIPSLLLMENAGRSVAEETVDFLKRWKGKSPGGGPGRVLVFCGKGNNGGDGLAAARHLVNFGLEVEAVLLAREEELKEDPRVNFEVAKKMGIPIVFPEDEPSWNHWRNRLREFQAILDGVLGIGTTREVEGLPRRAIEWMNASKLPLIAIDCPSGLNSDTGEVMGCAVRAHLTVTLALPKKGFYLKSGPDYCGEIRVVDISIPRSLLEAFER